MDIKKTSYKNLAKFLKAYEKKVGCNLHAQNDVAVTASPVPSLREPVICAGQCSALHLKVVSSELHVGRRSSNLLGN